MVHLTINVVFVGVLGGVENKFAELEAGEFRCLMHQVGAKLMAVDIKSCCDEEDNNHHHKK